MAWSPRKKTSRRVRIITWAKILTLEEQAMLLTYLDENKDTIQGRRERLIIDVLLRTGARCRELTKLRVKDTPFVLSKNAIEIYRGKNDKDREIPISQRLADELAGYIQNTRPKTLPRHIVRSDSSKRVFYSRRKKPLGTAAVYDMVVRIGKAAGIKKQLTPHVFRHTFATWALVPVEKGGSGLDITTVQVYMGHSDVSSTQKYLHPAASVWSDDGERLDRHIRVGFVAQEQLRFAYES